MRLPSLLLAEVGRRVATARQAAGQSLAELAAGSGVSRRFLSMIEAGQGNPSVLTLAAIAAALRVPLRELCDVTVESAPELRVALLGLRGAGKSTVGRLLAQELEVPFVELDALIEERAGLSLQALFDTLGEGFYRRQQREALETWLAQHGVGVLAPGGSIVVDGASFERLRSTCRTVWLSAAPEEHWRRVVAQGDLRPMAGHPRAMKELRVLLTAREPLYAQSDLQLRTDGVPPEEVARRISDWLQAPALTARR